MSFSSSTRKWYGPSHYPFVYRNLLTLACSWQLRTNSTRGMRSCVPPKHKRVAWVAILVLKLSRPCATSTNACSTTFHFSTASGKSTPTSSSLLVGLRRPKWWVPHAIIDDTHTCKPLISVQVYERSVANIPNSVDVWSLYCTFKIETNHDADSIRQYVPRPPFPTLPYNMSSNMEKPAWLPRGFLHSLALCSVRTLTPKLAAIMENLTPVTRLTVYRF